MGKQDQEFTVTMRILNKTGFDGIARFKKGDIRSIEDFTLCEIEIFLDKACENQGAILSNYYSSIINGS